MLAAVDPQVERLGWYLLPMVLLSSALTLVVSLLINNIQRQYPTYWWTPAELGKKKKADDIEKTPKQIPSSQSSLNKQSTRVEETAEPSIKITRHRIMVPDHVYLAQEERNMLEILRERLEEGPPSEPEPAIHG